MSQDSAILNRKILACNIAKYRKIHHLSREELSLALGFDNSYISKLEKSKVNITLDKLTYIADYFHIELKNLFESDL